MTETPPLYTGPICVAWIDDPFWMRAGDHGTVRNTIAALGPVAKTIKVTGNLLDIDEALAKTKPFSPLKAWRLWRWRRNAASILLRTSEGILPTVFVSTGQMTLRPSLRALRMAVKGPTLWLDVRGDVSVYRDNHPDLPGGAIINAALPDSDHASITEPGHSWITLPYLPERRTLPAQEAARAALEKRYGIALRHPIMAVLIGGGAEYLPIVDAGRALGADLIATTSRRTNLSAEQRKAWRENTRIFHEFSKSRKPNPYEEFLAAADYIAAAGDSLSIPSDVLALGKPIALFNASDQNNLIQAGFASQIASICTVWRPPPPHETPGHSLNRVVRTELAKLVGGGP